MSGAFCPPKLVTPGEGKTVMLFGVRFSYKVVSGDTGGRLAVLEVTIPPGPWSSRTTTPARTSSRWCCRGRSGPAGDQVTEASPGAYLVKPRGIPHAMWNTAVPRPPWPNPQPRRA